MNNIVSPLPQPGTPPYLCPGTDGELVYRRTVEIISGPQTSELPESGDGVAQIIDLQRSLAPLMHLPKNRTADRVVHFLVLLALNGLLVVDGNQDCVTLPLRAQA